MSISERWELMDSGQQRWIKVGAGVLGVFLVLWMVPGKESSERPDTVSNVEVDILGDDGGAGDLQQVIAENKVLKQQQATQAAQMQTQSKRIQNLSNSLSAATSLSENPEQLSALVDEMNRIKEDMQEFRETGQLASGNQSAQPPQLVLGGDNNETPSVGGGTTAVPNMSNPFSDVTDDAGPIAKYDPLARIKSAIEDGATDSGSANGDSRVNFTKDSSFERPPAMIVIEEPQQVTTRAARSAGARSTQSARDRRGELLEDPTPPEIYIPSGTIFEGVLLNGMDAPTSSGSASEPYPATIRLTSLAFLPNRYTINVRDCFVGAAGFGRLDSERVHLRTETLSCVLTDGGIIDVPLKAYVTGEDGKVGLRGTVVERTGALLMRAALAGVGSGFSEALQPRQIQSVRTGGQAGGVEFDAPKSAEVLEIGAYAGAASAMEKISDYYLERADQIFPIIELDALRMVTIHLQAGVTLKPINGPAYETLAKNESTR